jgi:hypothetical protein
MTRISAVGAVAIALILALALAAVPAVQAGEPEVGIGELECSGNPELVVIENTGGAELNFTGWTLVSDPTASERFDLSALRGLAAGGSVTIQSGPFASGPIQDSWGLEFVLRDGDPADFARIVDDSGATVDEVACAEAQPTPSPTPSSSPTPSGAIDGGGPPPPPVGSLTPSLLVLVGGSMAAAGAATFALPFTWFSSGTSPAQVLAQEAPAAAPVAARPEKARRRRRAGGSAVISLAVVGLVAAALFALIWRSR